MKTAWVFPGQGSQVVGMGADLADRAIARTKFAEAGEILGWSIIEKCTGSEAELARTLFNQPCLYVVEAILSDLLKSTGKCPDLVAGHSLGEYSALYAAGVFDFEVGLRLVQQRAELMEGTQRGKMAALMKFNRDQLEAAIAQTSDAVLANDNSSEQVVISGTPQAVDAILAQVKAKRSVPLKVTGAFHSPLMASAARQFQLILEETPFRDAQCSVLSNVNPLPCQDGGELKSRLMEQMTGSVRWREIMLQVERESIQKVIEVGPGKVLAGLFKRTCPDLTLGHVGTLEEAIADTPVPLT